jgi:uncharacterized protein
MEIEYDPLKSQRNELLRGLPFERIVEFDFEKALVWQDQRKLYPEPRFAALGFMGERLHFVCFSQTARGIRVISLRKANERERKSYEKLFAPH